MTILLDHCTPRKFLGLLQTWGYKVVLTQAHISVDASDVQVIRLAQELDAVLLTVDMDFANIVNYPPQNYCGIIVIRYGADVDTITTKTLKTVLEEMYHDKLRGCLVVIKEDQYKVR
jgi:predicted nuclease of predicted toxin-antitoxin system